MNRFSLILFLSILVLSGCAADAPTPYDHLVTAEADPSLSETEAETAIGIIESLNYSMLRDSLMERLPAQASVASTVFEIDPDGSLEVMDSSLVSVSVDLASLGWLQQLLPEQKSFASLRNVELFTYLATTDSAANTISTVTVPGSDVPGGLVSIDIAYNQSLAIIGVKVVRDGGGLFFRERSILNMSFSGDEEPSFDGLENTVVLKLPFKEAVAYRTLVSLVDAG